MVLESREFYSSGPGNVQSLFPTLPAGADESEIRGLIALMEGHLDAMQSNSFYSVTEAMNTIWLFLAVSELATMHIGFAMREAGLVREINVVTTYAKSMLGVTLSAVLTMLGTFNLAFPSTGTFLIGLDTTIFDHSLRKRLAFHLMAQTVTCSIVSGSMAERTTILASFLVNAFAAGVIHSLVARCSWGGGWLTELSPPFHDAAGSAVVHMCGGTVALMGALVLGSRKSRWLPENKGTFVPHSLSLTVTGVVLIWCGWYGYIFASLHRISDTESASSVSVAAVSTTISAAFAGLTAMAASMIRTKGETIDIIQMTNAIIGGLVAMAGGCDVIAPRSAAVVGIVAGILQQLKGVAFKYLQIDDVSDACAVHGVSGAWGALAVGLFHNKSGLLLAGTVDQLLSQVIGIGFIVGWAGLSSFCFLYALRTCRALRVKNSVETVGLDATLGFKAYVQAAQRSTEISRAEALLAIGSYKAVNVAACLLGLKRIINRPFTPHAGDMKKRGEVSDILEQLSFDADSHVEPYQLLVVHDAKDASEVATLFASIAEAELRTKIADQYEAQGSSEPVMKALSRSGASGAVKKTPSRSTGTSLLFGRAAKHSANSNLVRLTQVKLEDPKLRMQEVNRAQNVVVLLTRNVFTTPKCIFDLTHAYAQKKRLMCIHVEFQENDRRAFQFPKDIDRVILQWQERAPDETGSQQSSPTKSIWQRWKRSHSSASTGSFASTMPSNRVLELAFPHSQSA
mmetsp:Transcript_2651/g.6865  ORF Transcript_2651/g.6865 Transcript_2651/m.6865 type:complete len:740 (+) Transcript_2651:116-2335(+)